MSQDTETTPPAYDTRLTRAEWRRKMAAETFNFCWTLIDKPDRTRHEDEMMVHAAHGSRYLWQEAGDASNWAVGEWQVAHVYTLLGRTDQALHHARLCLETYERHSVGDWQLAFAYEAPARAQARAENTVGADPWAAHWIRSAISMVVPAPGLRQAAPRHAHHQPEIGFDQPAACALGG